MSKLLFHVSDEKYDTLKPHGSFMRADDLDSYGPCICFSADKFISHFGQYVYIFSFRTLNSAFRIDVINSGRLRECCFVGEGKTHIFNSQELGDEYRIHEEIDVDKYSLGVAEHWNHAEGNITTLMFDKVISRERVNLGEVV